MKMDTANPPNASYVLGHSEIEIERLKKQSQFLEAFTRRCLQDAGIRPGMKVLDVGCGAGDVSLIIAEMVGPEGMVIGVDQNQQVLETARIRGRAAGFSNLLFKEGDINNLDLDRDFEAVVGRLIFFHLKDPADTLCHLLNFLLQGGLVIFQDYDLFPVNSYPPSPLLKQTIDRIIEAFQRTGADSNTGLKLGEIFRQAGLPEPELRSEASISTSKEWPGYEQLALVTRAVLPLILKFGLATAEEVDVDTLATRLQAEVAGRGGVARGPDLVSAWTSKSS